MMGSVNNKSFRVVQWSFEKSTRRFKMKWEKNYESSKMHFVFDWNISTGIYEIVVMSCMSELVDYVGKLDMIGVDVPILSNVM
ncbi:hypothetical protein KY290_008254 [Solanum tuberosum]|uniref:Uncharacterized protein n=1 Tax=Solanum tuberosum TaxID=4113 RepID=A0ABQ7W7X5_SOLTU|nr:hypothetical protein KY289_008634 [Solanum tuberosum]KAH0776843.1 hypothetical protein KY290_008254 [Solanum tuberosum]